MDKTLPNKAYSQFEIKAVSEDKRILTGIATTISPDRTSDVVYPKGSVFKLPVPFLWQHDRLQPIGSVTKARVTDTGIEVEIQLVKVDAPSQLAARLEEAWQSIKSGLVRGLSIGFAPLKWSYMEAGGVEYQSWEFLELSAVTVPCNAEATITAIKSLSEQQAAFGKKAVRTVPISKSTGASVIKTTQTKPPEGQHMDIKEQIDGFKATRVAKAAEADAILTKAAGRTFDAAETEEYDTLQDDIDKLDAHIARLEKSLAASVTKAVAVNATPGFQPAAQTRTAPAVIHTTRNEEKGIGFVKFAMAMYAGQGDVNSAKSFAEAHFSDDVRLQSVFKGVAQQGRANGTAFAESVTKAAVAAGVTTNSAWAGALVDYRNLTNEFIEFLRPRTIVGRFGMDGMPSLRSVPFNVSIPGKTGAGHAAWVGEGARKPVTASAYATTELKWSKIAAISVISDELSRFAEPSIQMLVRDDLAEAVIERMDIDFVDPNKAAGTGVGLSPASMTNGVTPITSSGNDADSVRADIAALWEVADETNLPTASAVYITDSRTARRLSMLRNALGQLEFPGITVRGGTLDGVPVIVSNYVPTDSNGSLFILAFASEIYLADDGVVTVDISREATILMDDAAATATPTAAGQVSMWQTNQIALRAERYIHWKKRRPQAVAYLNGVNWGPTST